MNPEFQRNLWLEATPFRLSLIAGLLLLLFAGLAATPVVSVRAAALGLYAFFVVLWGTRSAALSVVGEIRERTWDSQKLSAIGPVEMVWGKLFGATIHCWFGGLICLPFILAPVAQEQGMAAALTYGAILLTLGIFAQAIALLSSLVLIRRQTGNWRLDTFLCQVAGIMAAFAYYTLWRSGDAFAQTNASGLSWWGHDFSQGAFHLGSLLLFTGWALVGCWRAMRAELRFANGPFVWLAWLAYIGLYDAGFQSWIARQQAVSAIPDNPVAARLALAAIALAGSTYSMVFLELKDPVRLRWLVAQLRGGQVRDAFLALDTWMLSYGATLLVGLVLAAAWAGGNAALSLAVIAALGFLTRDIGIFLVMRRFGGGKGDFAALAVLAGLYLLCPLVLRGLGAAGLEFLFHPVTRVDVLGVLAGWAQGLGVVAWAARSMGRGLPNR